MSDVESPAIAAPPPTPVEVKFTAKEEEILKVMWFCAKNAPEMDMKKLKEAAHFNTEKTCSNTWGTLKKKLAQIADGNGTGASSPASKSASPAKRTKKVADANDDDGAAEPVTPTKAKKARKSPVKKEAKLRAEDVEEEDMMGGAD